MIEIEEFIKFFYGINIKIINIKMDRYLLESNFKKYQLIDYQKNPNILYEKYIVLKKNNICCHDIILNKFGNIISEYDGRKYMLLKENVSINKNITLFDILNNNKVCNTNQKINIKQKWELKNDYYEDMISQLSSNNKVVAGSFDYYLGLSELAINLLNYVDFNNINCYFQHDRIKYNYTLEKFYNPIYIVLDSKIRDFVTYIKSAFFNDLLIEIDELFNKNIFNNNEIIYLIARLLYPDYYFDAIDEIVNNNLNNTNLEEYIKKSSLYEDYIKKIYKYLNQHYLVPKIEFLVKQC